MKTPEQFFSEITASNELSEKLKVVKSEQELVEFLKANGELSDEELENATGGGNSFVDELFDTAAFTIKLLRSKKLDKAGLEELIRKLQNNEITIAEIEEKYL